MRTIDFTQPVYKLNVENGSMWIEKKSLAYVVSESAEETTTPLGVGPKLHIAKVQDEWQLRLWGCTGRYAFVETCDSEEAAQQRWLEITYESDYLPSDESSLRFDSEDEAIQAYVEFWQDDDDEDPITVESVKTAIAESNAKHAEKIERIKQEDIAAYREGVKIYEQTGTISKKLRKICATIIYHPLRSNPWERLTEVHHSEEFLNEVRDFYSSVICKD